VILYHDLKLRLAAILRLFKIDHLGEMPCGVVALGWRTTMDWRRWLELIVQDNPKKRAIHLQPAVVVDETQRVVGCVPMIPRGLRGQACGAGLEIGGRSFVPARKVPTHFLYG
jgi:hypothetical protein